jgi:hypothetical protein
MTAFESLLFGPGAYTEFIRETAGAVANVYDYAATAPHCFFRLTPDAPTALRDALLAVIIRNAVLLLQNYFGYWY